MNKVKEAIGTYRQATRGPACVQIRDVVATCAACRALIRVVHLPRGAKRAYCWRCCPACGGALPMPEEIDRDVL
jgi:hypothetical protein